MKRHLEPLMSRRTFSALVGITATSAITCLLPGCSRKSSEGDNRHTNEVEHSIDKQPSSPSQEAKPALVPAGAVCVTEYASNTMAIIDVPSTSVIDRVPVGQNPAMMTRVDDTLFVGSSGGGEIVAIPLSDTAKAKRIPVGTQPLGLCFDEARRHLYVADYLDSSVHVVDPKLGSMIETIRLSRFGYHNRTDPPACCRKTTATGRRTVAFARSHDNSTLYCANYGTYDIARIDLETKTELDPFDGVVGPRALLMSHNGQHLMVAGVGGEDNGKVSTLSIIDLADGKRVREVPIGIGVADVCQTPDGARAYALARDEGSLVACECEEWTELGRTEVGKGVDSIALSANGTTVYCANSLTGTLTLVDVSAEIKGLSSPKDIFTL